MTSGQSSVTILSRLKKLVFFNTLYVLARYHLMTAFLIPQSINQSSETLNSSVEY